MVPHDNTAHVMLVTQDAEYASQEILCIFVRMEPDKVSTQDTFQYLDTPLLRKKAEYLKGRKRDMQEKPYRIIRRSFSYKPGE